MKTIKKTIHYITTLVLVGIFCISSSLVGLAYSDDNVVPEPKATLKIVDSSNNLQEIKLPDAEVKTITSRNANNVYTSVATVTLSGEILQQILRTPGSTTIGGDVTVTAGMNYEMNGNTISMRNVFGSYVPSGQYYAFDRKVTWAHSSGTFKGIAYPGSNNWQYTTNSQYIDWNKDVPPFVRAECSIGVVGMGGTGYNSAQFDLTF